MMLIPLGFGRPIPRFPVMTAAITVVTIFISVPFFKDVKAVEAARLKAHADVQYGQKLVDFIKQDCPTSQLVPVECEVASLTVDDLFKRLESQARPGPKAAPIPPPKMSPEVERLFRLASSNNGRADGGAARSLERIRVYVKGVTGQPRAFSPARKELSAYDALLEARSTVDDQTFLVEKAGGFLTRKTRGFKQLLLSQWTHEGWAHLLGNLFVFILLAIVLEQRMGALSFFALYVAGGTIGNLVQVSMFPDPSTFLLGASASIAAVIGGFFVFFYKKPMKVLVSLVVYNRTVFVPTWIVIPIMFTLNDVVGTINATDNVAHLAHLVGFAVGAIMAFVIRENDGLGPAYVYPIEYGWHVDLRKSDSLSDVIDIANRVLRFNPENYLVMEDALKKLANVAHSKPTAVGEDARRFLYQYLASALNMAVERRNVERIEAIIRALPPELGMIGALQGVSQANLIAFAERELKNGDWYTALRIYDVFRFHYQNSSGAAQAEESMRNVLAHVAHTGADLSILADYKILEPNTTFQKVIDQVLSQAPHASRGVHYERAS